MANVFADLGLPHPEEELLKAQIVRTLDQLVAEKQLTPEQAAGAFGIGQSDLMRIIWADCRACA